MKREDGGMDGRRKRRAKRVRIFLAKKRQARRQKERQKANESAGKEENGREKERVETERVALLQESEWTLPPGMFF